MKYGVIIYKDTDNIGDDILSYAGMQFLPHVDYVIDREALDTFVPNLTERVSVIMNGWYLHNKFNWPPSPYINPLLIGIHLSNDSRSGIKEEYLDGMGKDFLLQYAPIGCRDMTTLSRMNSRDIPAYFSGCVTLTLKRFEKVEKKDRYILVDVPDAVVEKVQREVGDEKVEVISHFIPLEERGSSWEIRCAKVESILKKYQSAKMVITTRLHCALPCLALRTPVMLLGDDSEDRVQRMGDYREYVKYFSINDFLEDKPVWNQEFENPSVYVPIRENIIAKCRGFIENCEKSVPEDVLPETALFSSLWKSKIEWQKKLLENDTMLISRSFYEQVLADKDWLANQYQGLTHYIHELESTNADLKQWNEELEKAKAWLEEHSQILEKRVAELEGWTRELEEGKVWLEHHNQELEEYVQDLQKRHE